MPPRFINTDTVILACEKTNQRLHGGCNILQPLVITFLYKSPAHVPINVKSRWFVPHTKKHVHTFAFLTFVEDHYSMNQQELINTVIQKLGSGNTGNVMEATGWSAERFDEGFQLANAMQNLDLVKLLYSNFNQNKIIIEFTLLGKARYHTLMR